MLLMKDRSFLYERAQTYLISVKLGEKKHFALSKGLISTRPPSPTKSLSPKKDITYLVFLGSLSLFGVSWKIQFRISKCQVAWAVLQLYSTADEQTISSLIFLDVFLVSRISLVRIYVFTAACLMPGSGRKRSPRTS